MIPTAAMLMPRTSIHPVDVNSNSNEGFNEGVGFAERFSDCVCKPLQLTCQTSLLHHRQHVSSCRRFRCCRGKHFGLEVMPIHALLSIFHWALVHNFYIPYIYPILIAWRSLRELSGSLLFSSLFFIFHFFFRMKIIGDVWRVYVGPKLKFQKISSSIPTIRLFRVGFAYYDDNDCMLSECGALLCIVLCYVRYLRHFPASKTIHARLHATST